MSPKPNLIIFPRWGGRPNSDWYPWAVQQLEADGLVDQATIHAWQEPDSPHQAIWTREVAQQLTAASRPGQSLVVAAHSVACQAVVRAVNAMTDPVQLAGFLAVAGWWNLDPQWASEQDPDITNAWLSQPGDLSRAKQRLGRIEVLLSTDDQFTPDQDTNIRLWETYLDAKCTLLENRGHYNFKTEEPDVLEALRRMVESPEL